MKVAWSSPTSSLEGGSGERFDPGIGSDRYLRALDWIRAKNLPRALASFTFDLDEPGSIVVAATDETTPPQPISPLPRGTVTDPGWEAWEAGFDGARTALESGELEKVVLARRVECTFESEVDAAAVWRRLVAANPGSYCFLVDGLVGASPELLTRVDGQMVESLALAGTAPAGGELAGDVIDREHRHAADSVADALRPLTTEIHSDRGIHRFGGLSHVGTRFHGVLRPEVSVLDVLAAVHPSAAVAGSPTDAAIRTIRANESPRGRYTGPVGWFDEIGNGEFAVALRCGLVAGDRVVLHAGGGLVRGSNRDRERSETTLKLGPMLEALGLES